MIQKIPYFLIMLLIISSVIPATFAGSGGNVGNDETQLDYSNNTEEHDDEKNLKNG